MLLDSTTTNINKRSIQQQHSLEHSARLAELQDSLALYERLQMKTEFLYTLRMLTLTILQQGDMQRLRELMIEYKFVLSWEEEQMMGRNANSFRITRESASANIMQMLVGED